MAAGFDLFSVQDVEVHPGTTVVIDTQVGIILPPGTYGRVAPRSSMSIAGIIVGGGVVDRDYTGSIGIILHNVSIFKCSVKKGDRIAQLIVEKMFEGSPQIRLDRPFEQLPRGNQGFGSTGK